MPRSNSYGWEELRSIFSAFEMDFDPGLLNGAPALDHALRRFEVFHGLSWRNFSGVMESFVNPLTPCGSVSSQSPGRRSMPRSSADGAAVLPPRVRRA